jgi:hypothetical protein
MYNTWIRFIGREFYGSYKYKTYHPYRIGEIVIKNGDRARVTMCEPIRERELV